MVLLRQGADMGRGYCDFIGGTVNASEAVRRLRKRGWKVLRHKGHIILRRGDRSMTLHNGKLGIAQERTVKRALQGRLTRQDSYGITPK